jgi:DNA-binding transcriptional ArsR family regulator
VDDVPARAAIDALRDALLEVGLHVDADVSPGDTGNDLVVHRPGGERFEIQVKARSLVASPLPVSLVRSRHPGGAPGEGLVIVVGERVTAEARAQLRSMGWGWLDLRGHLHVNGPGVFVDANVTPLQRYSQTRDPIAGRVGIEVAALLLMDPARRLGVRQVAAEVGRAPSSVSEALARLREAGLVEKSGAPAIPDLFRELVRRWRPATYDLATLPGPGDGPVNDALHLGLDTSATGPGWALGDSLAAAAYGAPLNLSGSYPPDLYVPDKTTVRRALQLLGPATDHQTRAGTLRLAPIALVCSRRVEGTPRHNLEWPLVHPLFVALDLAQDPGRGTEALEAWTPDPQWHRVW